MSICDRHPDFAAMIHLLPSAEGGRTRAAYTGYRPQHRLNDQLTSGEHDYLDQTCLQPGETAAALVKLIVPEEYPQSLTVGQKIMIQEGGHIVGYAVIQKILNPVLVAPEIEADHE